MEGGANVTFRFCFGNMEDGTVFPSVRVRGPFGASSVRDCPCLKVSVIVCVIAQTCVRKSARVRRPVWWASRSHVTGGDLIVLLFPSRAWAWFTFDPESLGAR